MFLLLAVFLYMSTDTLFAKHVDEAKYSDASFLSCMNPTVVTGGNYDGYTVTKCYPSFYIQGATYRECYKRLLQTDEVCLYKLGEPTKELIELKTTYHIDGSMVELYNLTGSTSYSEIKYNKSGAVIENNGTGLVNDKMQKEGGWFLELHDDDSIAVYKTYKNDVLNGSYIYIDSEPLRGKSTEGTYKNGKRSGKWTTTVTTRVRKTTITTYDDYGNQIGNPVITVED